jgi:hypothetical protein
MIKHEHLTPDTLLVEMVGAVTATDLADLDAVLTDTLGQDAKATVNLLLDLRGLTDVGAEPTPDSVPPEALIYPYLKRIQRLAAISDRHWVGVVVRVAGGMLPGLEARVFPGDQRAMARDFVLGQLAEPGDGKGPALRLLDSGHPDLIAYEIDGVLHQHDADRILDLLERALDRDRPVSLLVKIKSYGGFDPSMLLSGPLWTMKLAGIRHLHRYAVVGAEPWMQSVAQFANPLTLLNMKLFGTAAESEAWAWVKDGLGRAA